MKRLRRFYTQRRRIYATFSMHSDVQETVRKMARGKGCGYDTTSIACSWPQPDAIQSQQYPTSQVRAACKTDSCSIPLGPLRGPRRQYLLDYRAPLAVSRSLGYCTCVQVALALGIGELE